MKILLLRHGKTKGNLEGRYVGRTDEPLLPEAQKDLEVSQYKGFHPDRIYCSKLQRCRQTADILFDSISDGVEKVIWEGLEETDFGLFEYKNYKELNGHPAYQAWIDSGGTIAFPEGESGVDFRNRCCKAFEGCLEDAKEKGAQQIAIVVHGGTIMSIMERFAHPQADFYSWQVKNGEGFIVQLVEGETTWFLESL